MGTYGPGEFSAVFLFSRRLSEGDKLLNRKVAQIAAHDVSYKMSYLSHKSGRHFWRNIINNISSKEKP